MNLAILHVQGREMFGRWNALAGPVDQEAEEGG